MDMSIEISLVYVIGISMFAVALYYAFSTKPVTIYNQGKPPSATELTDVKKYNQTTAKLMFVYGCVFIAEGLFLASHPMICMIIGILTVIPGIVIVIAIYESYILKKYKIKN